MTTQVRQQPILAEHLHHDAVSEPVAQDLRVEYGNVKWAAEKFDVPDLIDARLLGGELSHLVKARFCQKRRYGPWGLWLYDGEEFEVNVGAFNAEISVTC